MRKIWCALMIPLLLLTSCGGKGGNDAEQAALEIRAKYLSMVGCTATLDITADYGERIFECVLELDHTTGGDTVLTVREPELLQGVTARLKNGESLLEFDGIQLETGALSDTGRSPIDCVPYLLKEIQEGFISAWSMELLGERECVRFTTSDPNNQPGQGQEVHFWFDKARCALVQGEISVDGFTALRCEVSDFTWKEKEE